MNEVPKMEEYFDMTLYGNTETGEEPDDEGDYYYTRERYWYHPNYLGNVDMITNDDGKIHQYFVYTPFGENMYQYNRNSEFNSRYRFNGKEIDPETGNQYYGARYYDPKISVWLSVDPKAYAFPNVSPYSLMMNNPVHMIDPGGDSTVYFVNYALEEADAQTVASHVKDIMEKNDITGLTYKVITPEESKGLKLLETDAIICLKRFGNDRSIGSTDVYLDRPGQGDAEISKTWVNLEGVDQRTLRDDNKESKLYGYAYTAAHEIHHQQIRKASRHFFGDLKEFGNHDNSSTNLNAAGDYVNVPKYAGKSKLPRPAEKMLPMFQNMIKHWYKQNGVK